MLFRSHLLVLLLAKTSVAIASGGKFVQLKKQVYDQLPNETRAKHLYFLPTSGGALFTYNDGVWCSVYEEKLTQEEANMITQAIRTANEQTHTVDFSKPAYGKRIEFRGTQVSFSALGQEAPLADKEVWDLSRALREKLRAALVPLLPNYEIRIGGTTTIDITKKGIDKAYGIQQLAKYLKLSISNMLYVGDELGCNGNDEVVLNTGIPTRSVKNPSDTKHFVESLLADRKSTRLNSSHTDISRMPSSA